MCESHWDVAPELAIQTDAEFVAKLSTVIVHIDCTID